MINILFGWTAIGWVAALLLAFRSAAPATQFTQIVRTFPPGGLCGPKPPVSWAGSAGPPPLRSGDEAPQLHLPPRQADPFSPEKQR